MSFEEGAAALTLIYELKSGWRVSENNLAEEQQYTRLKEATQ